MRKINRFIVALNGLKFVFKNEGHFKFHTVVFILILLLGYYFRLETWEWTTILLCSLFVFISEILNTALEQLCDYIQPKQDVSIGLIKDIAAGAVLISAIIVAVVGVIIFLPYIINEIQGLV